jgi:coatomer subunit delta
MTSLFPSRFRKRLLDLHRSLYLTCSYSDGSYPTVSSHTGEWALNASSHAIDWMVGKVDSQERSGTLEFSVGGDDAGVFFPVKVSFVAQGSIAGVRVASVTKVESGEDVVFSEDASVVVDNYTVV